MLHNSFYTYFYFGAQIVSQIWPVLKVYIDESLCLGFMMHLVLTLWMHFVDLLDSTSISSSYSLIMCVEIVLMWAKVQVCFNSHLTHSSCIKIFRVTEKTRHSKVRYYHGISVKQRHSYYLKQFISIYGKPSFYSDS